MQQQQPSADPADVFMKRRRTALWCSVSLFALSVLVLVIGLLSATHTDNVAVSGYYPGIILSFGSFLSVVGLNLVENRRPMLVASIIFISLGVVSCFLCSIIDGIIAAEFIDKRPLMEGRCEFFSSSSSHSYENYYTEVQCQSYGNQCKLKVKSNTCYCCDLFHCDSVDYNMHYYEFTGVSSCFDVVNLYRLMWACVALNVLGVFLGIVTAAVLGAFKDLHVSGFAAPASESSSTSPPEDPPSAAQSSLNPAPAAQTPDCRPEHSAAYMLTPNAPSLYAHSLGPFEKPPPYAC
ncbi:transmembrane protein 255B isoform X2 [Danio rerio]|uniref:Transmembrane protein 255B isoform X2 n=1 Tax=Danio rerio TaxID=7955 RepID=A0AC58JFX7_DANRE